MNNNKRLSVTKIVMASLLVIFAGCTISSAAPSPLSEEPSGISTIVANHTLSATRTSPPATQATSPTLAVTSIPSSTPTPTAQPAATELPKAIPTPPGTSLTEQVLWLYETNNGCQLPCWWGITPGQTTWNTAEQFFNLFASTILSASTSSPNSRSYSPIIPLPLEVFHENTVSPIYSARNGIVIHIGTDVSMGNTPPGYLTQYMLSTFLTTYGQPSEVWLSTYSASYSDLPFRVALFYPTQGIVALYSDNGIKQGGLVHGCPQQGPVKFLSLWDPSMEELTFDVLKSRTSAFNVDFISLEEATGMDVITFYETFKNPGNSTCLETPAHLWPTS